MILCSYYTLGTVAPGIKHRSLDLYKYNVLYRTRIIFTGDVKGIIVWQSKLMASVYRKSRVEVYKRTEIVSSAYSG